MLVKGAPGTGSSLAQVMVCCLFGTNNQNNVHWMSVVFFRCKLWWISIKIQCFSLWDKNFLAISRIVKKDRYLFLCHIILSVFVIHSTQVTSCWQIRSVLLCTFSCFLSLFTPIFLYPSNLLTSMKWQGINHNLFSQYTWHNGMTSYIATLSESSFVWYFMS